MCAAVTIQDETTTGQTVRRTTVEFLTPRVTVRELIRARVYQEAQDYNRCRPGVYRGLVQPAGAESTRDGYKLPYGRPIDWRPQFDRACAAFESGQCAVLINARPASRLADEVPITPSTTVTFIPHTPLVGG